jgi:hypothetical protein
MSTAAKNATKCSKSGLKPIHPAVIIGLIDFNNKQG